MSLQRCIMPLLALAMPACTPERELPPVPNIERLTFEGTLPEGFSLGGIAVMRATKKTRECFGTIEWLWRHTGGGDQQGYPLRDVDAAEFESFEGGRYRLQFRFGKDIVGGPCRWQLEGLQLYAKWGPEADGTMTVYTTHRSLDANSELWMGAPMRAAVALKMPCMYVRTDRLREGCEDRVAGDRGIPSFEGTLTIPLDVFVPGGLEAARTRLLAERSLQAEEIRWHDVRGDLREQERLLGDIMLHEDGGDVQELRDASADQLAERRAAIEREIARLKEDADRREQVLNEKFRMIAEKFEREREPYPPGYDAGSER